MKYHSENYIFLLYLSVILIIIFLQQEFVLIPELQNFDLVGEDAKYKIIESWQRWRWAAFVVAPLLLFLRLGLVSLCLFVGGFFFSDFAGRKVKIWWEIAVGSQSVMILYGIILCLFNIFVGSNEALVFTKYTSLLFFGEDDIEQWIRLPLSALNIFEIAYWLVMSKLVSTKTGNSFCNSFKFVMSSYGVGYMFYVVLLMFLILYLS